MRRIRSPLFTQLDIVQYCAKNKCERTEKNHNNNNSTVNNCLIVVRHSSNNCYLVNVVWLLCILVIVSCQWFNVVNSQTNHADEWAKKLLSGEQDKLHPVDPLTGEEISNRPLDYLAASEFPGDIVTKSEKTANYDDLWVPKQDSQERKLLESIGITTDKHSPCLCDNKYYRDCPPAIECTTTTYEGTVVNNNGMPKTTTLLSGDESVKPSSIMASKIVADTNNKDEIKPSVVTHQKILLPGYNEQASNYYNPKVDGDIQKLNNYIGQVKLRIPVVLPDLTMTATGAKQSLSLAGIPIDNQPMPMFKYKKYIQIGMKPQTQMVPMTTTIISPRLVSSR